MAARPIKTLVAWSTGKDSAYALSALRCDPGIEVVGLLSTLNAAVDRVSMHGVHVSVLEAQARACRLPLRTVPLPDPCSEEDYRTAMAETVRKACAEGVEAIAFGDLFLSDVRAYREANLAGTGLTPLFPLWGRQTLSFANEMIGAGLEAVITCVDTDQLDRSFLGRTFDGRLLGDLPPEVDPCAENGEFHTLAVAGPMFARRLGVEVGAVVERGQFVFVDVALEEDASIV